MIKMSDIAQTLGVSAATVSNALSGKGRMKEETRRQIQEAAQAMGYVMPQPARSCGPQIIVIAEANEISFTTFIVTGITAAAREAGMNCAIYNLDIVVNGPGRDATVEYLRPRVEECLAQHPAQPAALIYLSQYPRPLPGLLADLSCPAVAVMCGETGAQLTVNYDDQQGAYLAVTHLIATGCQKIAMLSGPVDNHAVSERMIGYQRALIAGGLAFHPKRMWIGNWEVSSGYTLAQGLIASEDRPDAIFAQNDSMAVGALQAAQEMGLRVPEQMSIVGFDDTMFATWTRPMLTSVAPPFDEMGRAAFAGAHRLAAGKTIEQDNLRLPCTLSLRGTTRK